MPPLTIWRLIRTRMRCGSRLHGGFNSAGRRARTPASGYKCKWKCGPTRIGETWLLCTVFCRTRNSREQSETRFNPEERARAHTLVHLYSSISDLQVLCIGWLSDPRAPFCSPTSARSRCFFFFLFFFSILLVSPNERCMEQNSGRHRQSVWLPLFCPVLPLCSSTSLQSLSRWISGSIFFFHFSCRLQLFVSRTDKRSILICLTINIFQAIFGIWSNLALNNRDTCVR